MVSNSKIKIFKDPVHGYIEIPSDICTNFIDTPIFQRLKHIRQTNMIGLYPAANHNRFIHSLGVFHLGKIAFNWLLNNIKTKISEADYKYLSKLKKSFLITCLMHDCGHSPFSHSLEAQYDKKENTVYSKLNPLILRVVNNKRFEEDFRECNPAAHEKVTVIVLIKYFKKQLDEYNVDPVLAARMILGCKYHCVKNVKEKLKNCLIELLNSRSIDVDKLDYILRDTWSSGVSNQNIDVARLLFSLTISTDKKTPFELAFKKSSLSVIKSVVDGRNYLYKWAYGHHEVVYEQELLENALDEVAKLLYKTKPEEFNSRVFSVDSFFQHIELKDKTSLYLVTDGDLIYLLKKHIKELPSAKRLFFRNHHKILWKTYEEFDDIFDHIENADRKIIEKKAKSNLYRDMNTLLRARLTKNDVLVLNVKPKISEIEENQVLIEIDKNKCLPFYDVFKKETKKPKDPISFFYIYYPPRITINKSNRDKIFKTLRSYK